MFKDMTLIKRVALLSLTTLVSIITILTFSLSSLSTMNDNFNTVIQRDAAASILSKDIKANLIEMQRAEKNIILALTQEDMQTYNNNFLDAQKAIEKNIVNLRILVENENVPKLERINTLYNKYLSVYHDIYKLTQQNSNQKAKALLRGAARDKIIIVDALTDQLALVIKDEMLKEVAQSKTDIKVAESKLQALVLISSIESSILKSVRDAGRAILLLTQEDIREMINRSNAHLEQAKTDAKKLKSVTDTDTNKKIASILVALDVYDSVQSHIFRLTLQNSNQKAIDLSTTQSKEYISQSQELISEIVAYSDNKMLEAKILSDTRYDDTLNRLLILFSVVAFILMYVSALIYRYINERLSTINDKIQVIKTGSFEDEEEVRAYNDEFGLIASSLSNAINLLRDTSRKTKNESWVKEGLNTLNKTLSAETETIDVSNKSINFLCTYLKAGIGSLYIFDKDERTLQQFASYAYVQRQEIANKFALGEGTVGQVALQKSPIHLRNIKRTQLVVDTGTTSEPPLNTYTFPLLYQDELYGVIELGSSEIFDAKAAEFFLLAREIIATALYTTKQNQKVKILLEDTQLKNEEIEEANAQMQEQQQQLEEANAQMEEQQQQLKEKNLTLEQSQIDLDKRAEDLVLSNIYKSEFLANMSHELRTPLNSIILLSEMLQEDKNKHLDTQEIKKASIIHNSGNELLRLINDILDLSKVEAGKMDIIVDTFESSAFNKELRSLFEHQAQEKKLKLITLDNYKGIISSDKDRLSQVLRNLISNSLKFTKEGSITLNIESANDNKIKISVSDTGIGIDEDKLHNIFEAFQQADGSTSREYGGTGLGLSISREIARALGGEINVESKLGEGSTFTVIVPNIDEEIMDNKENRVKQLPRNKTLKAAKNIDDDRKLVTEVDEAFLIIDDDEDFAHVLKEQINNKSQYALIALNGEDGLKLAREYNIKGVLLDLDLPDMNGIDVLKEFKTNMALRKIPIYVISEQDQEKQTAENGAIGYNYKPLDSNDISDVIEKINAFNKKKMKDLLVVEDDDVQREALVEFIGNGTVKSTGVSSKAQALEEIDKGIYDGIIIDLGLKDGTGYEICEYIKQNNLHVPIIIYTGKDLSADEEKKLRQYTDTIVIKTVASQKRLLEEVDIFMHRVNIKHKDKVHNVNDINLSGTKILIADDDIRNIYVLSEALSSRGAEVITASNGKEAITLLDANDDTDIILMDIMMPVMNGYEAAKSIKSNAKTKDIPIIAVTAKAMLEDRQKALDAGCDDYVSKPLKMDILIGIIKGWTK